MPSDQPMNNGGILYKNNVPSGIYGIPLFSYTSIEDGEQILILFDDRWYPLVI